MTESAEDEMVAKIIDYYKDSDGVSQLAPEAHYNYYGDRGVADLVEVHESGQEVIVAHELKSAAAVNAATGANEILRQFNRMVKYLPKDEEWEADFYEFNLLFIASEDTIVHVMNNLNIYQQARRNGDNYIADVRFVHPAVPGFGALAGISGPSEINYYADHFEEIAEMVDTAISKSNIDA